MIQFRFAILLLSIYCCASQNLQWVVTHHEGYNSNFNQIESDIGSIIQCKQGNISIINSPFIKKTISLKDFKPFARTTVVIDYLKPNFIDVQVQIQNKTYDPFQQQIGFQRSIKDDCLGEGTQYIEKSFTQEIIGNSLEEINIVLQAGKVKGNTFIIQSDQQIAIKQIHILQVLCPQFCKRCVYQDSTVVCTTCDDGFEANQNGCSCINFMQNNNCVEKCYDGYTSDSYSICQETTISRSIILSQNLRKNYKKYETFDIELDLQNSKYFQVEMEVQIYNLQFLSIFEIHMNNKQFMQYINVDSPKKFFGLTSMSQKDCEFEDFCQVYHFKSQIFKIDQGKLQLQASLEKAKFTRQANDENNSSYFEFWKLINLKVNILKIYNEIPLIKNCIDMRNKGTETQCIKCQVPFTAFNGQCINKCPLIQPKSDEICFNSDSENTQLLLLSEFNSGYMNPSQTYFHQGNSWIYNKQLLISGYMIWSNFENQLNSPHYGITIQAKIIFIDYKNDTNFVIVMKKEMQQLVVLPKNQVIIGGKLNTPDSIVYINQFIPHNSTELDIEIISDPLNYITNFVLLVHKCVPYCKSCTGPKQSQCLEYYQDLVQFDVNKLQCNPGYYETIGKQCQTCLDPDCSTCIDGVDCLQCKVGCILTKYGLCQCQ